MGFIVTCFLYAYYSEGALDVTLELDALSDYSTSSENSTVMFYFNPSKVIVFMNFLLHVFRFTSSVLVLVLRNAINGLESTLSYDSIILLISSSLVSSESPLDSSDSLLS